MTSMERVLLAMQNKEADRVPVYPILSGVTRNLTGVSYPVWSTDADACAAALLKSAEDFELDCLVTLIDLSVECDAWGQKIIFPENEAAHPDRRTDPYTYPAGRASWTIRPAGRIQRR